MTTKLFLGLVAMFAVLSLSAEESIVRLVSGGTITGEVLKNDAEAVVIDLGFTALRIPRSAVESVDPTDRKKVTGDALFGKKLFREGGERRNLALRDLVQKLGEAVVMVRTPTGLGSGFIIHPDGYVVTNDHVIAGERKISITQFRQTKTELTKVNFDNVRIVASSAENDLALLKIEDSLKGPLPTVPLGNSDGVKQGQRVFAVGSPLGLERSVSEGIVSLRNRLIEGRLHVQTTAEISPGNSGGPLFNYRGEVVGVNNMKVVAVGAEGLGFSIPVRTVKTFLMNRDAFAFDPRNPNAGFRYVSPPR
ncbi:MAG: trypsin-like peptidase domain-containing protein [Opitutales bacterium]